MPPRPSRTWSLLAGLAALCAVMMCAVVMGVGAAPGSDRSSFGVTASGPTRRFPAGTLDAALLRETERLETVMSTKAEAGARFVVLLAMLLAGSALSVRLAPSRAALAAGGAPSAIRLRRWVSRRAPPSAPLVSLTR